MERERPPLKERANLDLEGKDRLSVDLEGDRVPAAEFDLRRRRRPLPVEDIAEGEPERAAERGAERDKHPAKATEALPISEEQYREARALAERKFGFIKTFLLITALNCGLAMVSWLQIPPTGKYWFVWPAAASLLVVIGLYIRIFLFGGQDLRTIIERRLEAMTEAEIRREKSLILR